MKNNYNSYIKSSKWKSIRNLKANLQNHICEMCGKQVFRDFEVHHNTYKNFGHEKLTDLTFLCKQCHRKIHKDTVFKHFGKGK